MATRDLFSTEVEIWSGTMSGVRNK